jgi:hypothetical protein
MQNTEPFTDVEAFYPAQNPRRSFLRNGHT